MADITIVNGVYKPTYNWGAPSCTDITILYTTRKKKKTEPEMGWMYGWCMGFATYLGLSRIRQVQPLGRIFRMEVLHQATWDAKLRRKDPHRKTQKNPEIPRISSSICRILLQPHKSKFGIVS
jgi:hypothetical protein